MISSFDPMSLPLVEFQLTIWLLSKPISICKTKNEVQDSIFSIRVIFYKEENFLDVFNK